MKKLLIIVLLVVLLGGCFWTPYGARGMFGYWRDGQYMTTEEARAYAEEYGILGDDMTEVTIIIDWGGEPEE